MTFHPIIVTRNASDVFSLNETDFHILNYYGKNGPVFRNKVNLFQELSRRQTARQIDALFNQGYLHLIKSKKYRNKKKFTKLYGLSIKGFIASLNEKNLQDNYFFKQYLSLFPEELKKPVKKFLSLCIAEFILYHKSIGLKIDTVHNMPKYIKEIIYDYDLITDKDNLEKFKKIDDDIYVIDEIRDILHDMKNYEHAKYPEGSIKCEFLINFWPYVIDELGKGTKIELELENISSESAPFGLTEYEEDLLKIFNEKQSMISNQWAKRKLNYLQDPSFSRSYF